MGCYSNILGSRQKSLLDSSALATLEMHLASCQADIDKEVARVGELLARDKEVARIAELLARDEEVARVGEVLARDRVVASVGEVLARDEKVTRPWKKGHGKK